MVTAAQHGVFSAEPVLWTSEYLLDILETLDASAEDEHSLSLLSLEREELEQVWHSLSAGCESSGPVFYSYGLTGARLFVIHQLLAAMPAAAVSRQLDKAAVLGQACRHFLEIFFLLSSLAPALAEKAPGPAVVERALRLGHRLLPGPATDGRQLHLYCLDYTLPAPACYLPFSHTLLCGANNLSQEGQLRSLLRHFILARQITKRATAQRSPAPAFIH